MDTAPKDFALNDTSAAGCNTFAADLQYVGSKCFEDAECSMYPGDEIGEQCLEKITNLQGIPDSCVTPVKKDKKNRLMNAGPDEIFQCVNSFDAFAFSSQAEAFEVCDRCESCYGTILMTILKVAIDQGSVSTPEDPDDLSIFYDTCVDELTTAISDRQSGHAHCELKNECHDFNEDKGGCESLSYCSYYQRCNVHYGPKEDVRTQVAERFDVYTETPLSEAQSTVCESIKQVFVDKMTAGEKPCQCTFGVCDCEAELTYVGASMCDSTEVVFDACEVYNFFETRYKQNMQDGYSMGAEDTYRECVHFMEERSRGQAKCNELENDIRENPSILYEEPTVACMDAGEDYGTCMYVIETFQGLTFSNRLEFAPETFTQICEAHQLHDWEQIQM